MKMQMRRVSDPKILINVSMFLHSFTSKKKIGIYQKLNNKYKLVGLC